MHHTTVCSFLQSTQYTSHTALSNGLIFPLLSAECHLIHAIEDGFRALLPLAVLRPIAAVVLVEELPQAGARHHEPAGRLAVGGRRVGPGHGVGGSAVVGVQLSGTNQPDLEET